MADRWLIGQPADLALIWFQSSPAQNFSEF